jgi:hypothetical protein
LDAEEGEGDSGSGGGGGGETDLQVEVTAEFALELFDDGFDFGEGEVAAAAEVSEDVAGIFEGWGLAEEGGFEELGNEVGGASGAFGRGVGEPALLSAAEETEEITNGDFERAGALTDGVEGGGHAGEELVGFGEGFADRAGRGVEIAEAVEGKGEGQDARAVEGGEGFGGLAVTADTFELERESDEMDDVKAASEGGGGEFGKEGGGGATAEAGEEDNNIGIIEAGEGAVGGFGPSGEAGFGIAATAEAAAEFFAEEDFFGGDATLEVGRVGIEGGAGEAAAGFEGEAVEAIAAGIADGDPMETDAVFRSGLAVESEHVICGGRYR